LAELAVAELAQVLEAAEVLELVEQLVALAEELEPVVPKLVLVSAVRLGSLRLLLYLLVLVA